VRIAAIFVLIALIVGCSAFSGVNTLAGENARVIEKARVILNSTRLRSEQLPQVVSAQKLSFEQAHRELPASVSKNSDLASNSSVWLVIFKGQWQVLPPDPSHTITPVPPTEGCVFVLMDANENGLQVGGPSSCTTPSTILPAATVLALGPADRLAIYSAVAHYAFDPSNKMGSGARHYPVIFVSPNLATSLDPLGERWDGDPTPPGVLPLFNDLAPRVEFATKDSVIQRDKMNAVRDDGIWLGFGAIQVEGNQARVRSESLLNGTNAAAYEYQLGRQADHWIVLSATLLWIS
jgi:hypothetical protein